MPLVTPLRPDDLRRVGRYRLSGRIADSRDDPTSAGMFLSRLPDGTPVAVTLLSRMAAPDSASRDRFTAEATAARRVAPFCAARILDAGFDGGQPFLVSEFIEGPSLAETVAAEGSLEDPALAALAIGTATGLTSIHQAGLVHGDFGPDHVVLGAEGPRVVHFSTTPPIRSCDPLGGPVRLGPDDPVRRGTPRRRQPARAAAEHGGRLPVARTRPAAPRPGAWSPRCSAGATRRPGSSPKAPGGPGPRAAAWSARTPAARPRSRPCPGPAASPGLRPAWPASGSSWWPPR